MVRRKGSESPFAIYCWFIQVLIVLSLTAVVIWLSSRPRSPKFTITSVYIPQTGNQNFSQTVGNNSLVFLLDITNPNNGMTICYVDISMKLHDGGFLVGNKSVEAFCQGQRKTVTEEVLVNFDQQFMRANVGGGEFFRASVETRIKFHFFKWKTKIRHLGFDGFVKIGTKGNITENIYLHKTPYVHT